MGELGLWKSAEQRVEGQGVCIVFFFNGHQSNNRWSPYKLDGNILGIRMVVSLPTEKDLLGNKDNGK